MSKYLQLQIPKACNENWDKMDAAKQGKFCNACQKNVIDFTLLTDDDLARFFKNNNENVCGKFTNDQLNTDIRIPAKKIPWLKYFFTITIPAFLFSQKTNAQTNDLKGKVVCVETKQTHMIGETSVRTSKLVNGEIIDESGRPIPYATVRVKDTKQGTAADSAGKFKIELPYSHPVLEISAIGYSTKEIDCSTKTISDIISIKMEMRELKGMVGTIVITKKKKKFLPVPAILNNNSILSNSFSVFPNPVSAFSKLNIKWKDAVTADQVIEIYNQTGNLLQQEIIRATKKINEQSINLQQLPAGTYIIKITDNKTHKSSSQQFIVE